MTAVREGYDLYETRQLRVLCLHSYRTNGAIFMAQMQAAGWYAAFPDVNFVCIDGPYECDSADEAEMARGIIDGDTVLNNFPKARWGAYREWWQERETMGASAADDAALEATLEPLVARASAALGAGAPLVEQLASYRSGGTLLGQVPATLAGLPADVGDASLKDDCRAAVAEALAASAYKRHPAILAHLKKHIYEHGRFDGLLGFSTGAALAFALLASAERDAAALDVAPLPRAGGLGFAMLLSPYVPRDPALAELWAPGTPLLQTRTLLAAAARDRVVPAADARAIRALFAADAVVAVEDAGDRHAVFPVRNASDPNVIAIREFLHAQLERKNQHTYWHQKRTVPHFIHWVTADSAQILRGPHPDATHVRDVPHGTAVWVVGNGSCVVGEGRKRRALTFCRLTFPFEAWINRKFISAACPRPHPRLEDGSDDEWAE